MSFINNDALSSFREYLYTISSLGISAKTAAEIATNITKGMYNPIYAQIDPVRLGEMHAALQIAEEYGSRLNQKSRNLKDGSLGRLINGYPTHGFVIDRAEARDLFNKVTSPDDELIKIAECIPFPNASERNPEENVIHERSQRFQE